MATPKSGRKGGVAGKLVADVRASYRVAEWTPEHPAYFKVEESDRFVSVCDISLEGGIGS